MYGITSEGRRELSVLRRQAVADVDEPPRPTERGAGVRRGDAPAELYALLARRKEALLARAARPAAERADGEREGYLLASVSPLQAASFRRAEVRVAAELAWHEECEKLLGLPADGAQVPLAQAGAGLTRAQVVDVLARRARPGALASRPSPVFSVRRSCPRSGPK